MLEIIEHPLAQHLLSILRDKNTEPAEFRDVTRTLTTLLCIYATRDLAVTEDVCETPIAKTKVSVLSKSVAAVPILRAGLGMLEAVVELFPIVSVGYIGLERDEKTALAHSYYNKLPPLKGNITLLLDPMLATGGSGAQAITALKEKGAKDIRMLSVVVALEGFEKIESEHPDVKIFAAALDEKLNSRKFIVPGLGDFGDRLYGTK